MLLYPNSSLRSLQAVKKARDLIKKSKKMSASAKKKKSAIAKKSKK